MHVDFIHNHGQIYGMHIVNNISKVQAAFLGVKGEVEHVEIACGNKASYRTPDVRALEISNRGVIGDPIRIHYLGRTVEEIVKWITQAIINWLNNYKLAKSKFIFNVLSQVTVEPVVTITFDPRS